MMIRDYWKEVKYLLKQEKILCIPIVVVKDAFIHLFSIYYVQILKE